MENRAGYMTGIEAIPSRIVETIHVRSRDPYLAPYRKDIGAVHEKGHSLLRVRPISIDEQPRRGDLLEMADQRMQVRTLPRWIGDDRIEHHRKC